MQIKIPFIFYGMVGFTRPRDRHYYAFFIDCNSFLDKNLPYQNIVFVSKFSYKSNIIIYIVLFFTQKYMKLYSLLAFLSPSLNKYFSQYSTPIKPSQTS